MQGYKVSESYFIDWYKSIRSLYDKEANDAQCVEFYKILGTMSEAELERLKLAIQLKCKFAPTIGDISEIINGTAAEQKERRQSEAINALHILKRAIALCGRSSSVCFNCDMRITRAIELAGGWEAVCNLEGDEWVNFCKWEWQKLYEAAKDSVLNLERGYLMGAAERSNLFNNQAKDEVWVKMIGVEAIRETPAQKVTSGWVKYKQNAKMQQIAPNGLKMIGGY